jgi:glucokinase
LAVGVDVGTTKIATGVVGFHDRTQPGFKLTRRINHSEIGSEVGILDRIESSVKEIWESGRVDRNSVDYIGVGVPGIVDYRTGLLKFAAGLKLKNINVKGELEERLNKPVFVDNDVNCATLAELHYGAGRVFSDFVCIFVGTGIGSGLVLDNRLIRGHTFSAGEIGHMKIEYGPTARKCTCGSYGCFEEYASARAIVRLAREKIFEMRDRNEEGLLRELDPNTLTPHDVVRLIKAGDPSCSRLAEQIAGFLAVGFANVANMFNPEAIIVGGGIIQGFFEFDFFNALIRDRFSEYCLNVCSETDILTSRFKLAPMIGAACLGRQA